MLDSEMGSKNWFRFVIYIADRVEEIAKEILAI